MTVETEHATTYYDSISAQPRGYGGSRLSPAAVGLDALLLAEALQLVQLRRELRLLDDHLKLRLRMRPHQVQHLCAAQTLFVLAHADYIAREDAGLSGVRQEGGGRTEVGNIT